jgi:phosphoglycerate dehydrogenase-like enzyme
MANARTRPTPSATSAVTVREGRGPAPTGAASAPSVGLVVALDRVGADVGTERSILEKSNLRIEVVAESGPARTEQLRQAVGLLANRTRIGPALLDSVPQCRCVVTYGVGYDHVDLDEARRRRVVVCNVRDYCSEEVADHTMALTLAVLRRVLPGDAEVRAGGWGIENVGAIRRLRGLVMGLVGYGRIGQLVRDRAIAFGLRVVAYDPAMTSSQREDLGADTVSTLEELLRAADIVSLHAPLQADTRDLINAKALDLMKSGSYLINTSRGGLVDDTALLRALDSGHLAGAGLDVFSVEPPPPVAFDRPEIVLTPHTAFYSIESIEQLKSDAALIMAGVLSGGSIVNRIV